MINAISTKNNSQKVHHYDKNTKESEQKIHTVNNAKTGR